MEFVNPEGLRLDGRRPTEMRQLRAEIGTVAKADGSAVFEMGNTKVIAAVYGPREVQNKSQQMSDQALIDISVQVLQADGGTRSACINAATLALQDAGIPLFPLNLNYVEDSAGGPDVTVGILPMLDKVTLLQMDAKLPQIPLKMSCNLQLKAARQ